MVLVPALLTVRSKWRKADHSAVKSAKFFPRAISRFSLKIRYRRPWASPKASAGNETDPVFQLVPQAVINADGLLQMLVQVPDFTKMLL